MVEKKSFRKKKRDEYINLKVCKFKILSPYILILQQILHLLVKIQQEIKHIILNTHYV